MRILSIGFTKIAGERKLAFSSGTHITTNMEFTNIEKEEVEVLKDTEALRIGFEFKIKYQKDEKVKSEKGEADISIEGVIIASVDKEESKTFLKNWKKKEMPDSAKIPLFNLILRKCTLKALELEDTLELPTHIAVPQISQQNNQPTLN